MNLYKCLTLGPDGVLALGIRLNAKSASRTLEVCVEGDTAPIHEKVLAIDPTNPPAESSFDGGADPQSPLALVVSRATLRCAHDQLLLAEPDKGTRPRLTVHAAYAKRHILVKNPEVPPACFCSHYWGWRRGPFPDVGIAGSWCTGEAVVTLNETRTSFVTWPPGVEQSPVVVSLCLVGGEPKAFVVPHHLFAGLGAAPSCEELTANAISVA